MQNSKYLVRKKICHFLERLTWTNMGRNMGWIRPKYGSKYSLTGRHDYNKQDTYKRQANDANNSRQYSKLSLKKQLHEK